MDDSVIWLQRGAKAGLPTSDEAAPNDTREQIPMLRSRLLSSLTRPLFSTIENIKQWRSKQLGNPFHHCGVDVPISVIHKSLTSSWQEHYVVTSPWRNAPNRTCTSALGISCAWRMTKGFHAIDRWTTSDVHFATRDTNVWSPSLSQESIGSFGAWRLTRNAGEALGDLFADGSSQEGGRST